MSDSACLEKYSLNRGLAGWRGSAFRPLLLPLSLLTGNLTGSFADSRRRRSQRPYYSRNNGYLAGNSLITRTGNWIRGTGTADKRTGNCAGTNRGLIGRHSRAVKPPQPDRLPRAFGRRRRFILSRLRQRRRTPQIQHIMAAHPPKHRETQDAQF